MKELQKEAQELSFISGYAWIMSNGKDIYITDNDEVVQGDMDKDYKVIAEYIKGEKIV